jgi:antitoxin MazE
MMASVVQIGNSRGIRLPKNILRELKIKDEVEMIVHNDSLIIKNVEKKPREGWNEAFSQMSKNKEDKLLLENIDSNDFEWVW